MTNESIHCSIHLIPIWYIVRIFFLAHTNGYNEQPLRILLFAESFPSFTSGITRRFKEIIRRLAKRKHYVHVITGCKVINCFFERQKKKRQISFFIWKECTIMGRRKSNSWRICFVFNSTIDRFYKQNRLCMPISISQCKLIRADVRNIMHIESKDTKCRDWLSVFLVTNFHRNLFGKKYLQNKCD